MTPTLRKGMCVGRYRIEEWLGSGGMGEVYAARDETLNRVVALKILPADLERHHDRLRRFLLEARAASSLTHPGLVAIHEIGEAVPDGVEGSPAVPFIAMELVRGDTLEEIFRGGRAELREVIGWLAGAASAVAAVHAAGIVHRDLKPGNIMINRERQAKVLDFGLAKRDSIAEGSPHDTIEQTAEGTVVGTIHYMSPEQVSGKPVDHRSDIFSLGCIVYEAATGRRPFSGATRIDVMHAVLHDEPPPVHEINAEAPTELRRLIRRCLAKNPDRRYQSMRDVAIELGELSAEWDELSRHPSSSSSGPTRTLARPWSPVMTWSVAALLLLGLAALGAWWLSRRQTVNPRFHFSQVSARTGMELGPSLSPDGRFVIYQSNSGGDWDLFLLRIGGQNPIALTRGSDADDTQPAFSPDGQTIAFRSEREGGGIFLMGATGESVRRLSSGGFNPAWSPDGRRVACDSEGPPDPYGRTSVSALRIIDVRTGESKVIFDGDAVEPSWSPDGRHIVFWGMPDATGSNRDIGTIAAEGGEPDWLMRDAALDWSPVWSPDGQHIYFASDRGGSMNLWRVGVDPASGRRVGDVESVTAPSRWAGQPTFSADGSRLLYVSLQLRASIETLPFDRDSMTVAGQPRAIVTGNELIGETDLSPGGGKLVYRSSHMREDLFVMSSDGTGIIRLTDDDHRDRAPRWSADEGWIIFYSDRSGSYEAWRIRADGSGLQQLTEKTGREITYPSLSPDGLRLAAYDFERGTVLIDVGGSLPATRLHAVPSPSADEIFLGIEWSADGEEIFGFHVRRAGGSASSGIQVTALAAYRIANGRYRELLRLDDPAPLVTAEWLRGGKGVLMASGSSLFLFDPASRSSRILFDAPGARLDSPAVAADGGPLYFVRQIFEADLWMATVDGR